MRVPADMKESDAANNVNNVNKLMRKGGCSDLVCILMKLTSDSRNVQQLQTKLGPLFGCSLGYKRDILGLFRFS